MMRRNLILLAVLLAGIGGAWSAEPTASAGGDHAIAAAGDLGPTAFARSAAAMFFAPWQEGSGPAPRPLFDRPRFLAGDRLHRTASSRHAGFQARSASHRGYAARFALARAGRSSFNTTTPPPFRIV